MPDTATGNRGGGRSGGNRRNKYAAANKQLAESLRDICPPHKQNELEALVKSLKGDEEKCRERIAEWWDEPVAPAEGEWEDVSKKPNASARKKDQRPSSGRGGGGGGGGGGGREGRGRGRGGRSKGEGRGRGRGEGRRDREDRKDKRKSDQNGDKTPPSAPEEFSPSAVPAVAIARAPQGAWAKKTPERPSKPEEQHTVVSPAPEPEPVVMEAPAPAALVAPPPPAPKPVGTTGNVWATKGSAHLIQKEKPKPKPPPAQIALKPVPIAPKEPQAEPQPPAPVSPTPAAPALETGNAWNTAASPSLGALKPPMDLPQSPVVTQPIAAPPAVVEKPAAATPSKPAQPSRPANRLNMGHWETGDADDNNMDFGFGFDGEPPKSETGPATKENAPPPPPPAAAASPARPPPGLSIGGGMPPMPANAVLVHELENKLGEAVNLNPKQSTEKPLPSTLPASQPPHVAATTSTTTPPPAILTHPTYAAPPGVYPGNAFVGMPAAAMPQQQQQGQLPQHPTHHQQPLPPQQGGLYGHHASAPSSGNAPGITATDSSNSSAPNTGGSAPAGMPPGMPANAMPYGSPAMYYGQQPFHMGQHQGGIGYNYGYGAQFGNTGQVGFGYPQAMGQNTGYGAPHYGDDRQTGGNQGGRGYQKNSGGYRGGRGHNNSNAGQYQNQYNPAAAQHGGYGGQPYGMGYHGDHHFNAPQRGGYGGMQDPYGMQQQPQQQQQQQQQGGSSYGGGGDDRRTGGRLPQFQQHQSGPPQGQLGGPPPFGLQAQDNTSQQTGGWSNQSGGDTAGGWSGAASGWQGK